MNWFKFVDIFAIFAIIALAHLINCSAVAETGNSFQTDKANTETLTHIPARSFSLWNPFFNIKNHNQTPQLPPNKEVVIKPVFITVPEKKPEKPSEPSSVVYYPLPQIPHTLGYPQFPLSHPLPFPPPISLPPPAPLPPIAPIPPLPPSPIPNPQPSRPSNTTSPPVVTTNMTTNVSTQIQTYPLPYPLPYPYPYPYSSAYPYSYPSYQYPYPYPYPARDLRTEFVVINSSNPPPPPAAPPVVQVAPVIQAPSAPPAPPPQVVQVPASNPAPPTVVQVSPVIGTVVDPFNRTRDDRNRGSLNRQQFRISANNSSEPELTDNTNPLSDPVLPDANKEDSEANKENVVYDYGKYDSEDMEDYDYEVGDSDDDDEDDKARPAIVVERGYLVLLKDSKPSGKIPAKNNTQLLQKHQKHS